MATASNPSTALPAALETGHDATGPKWSVRTLLVAWSVPVVLGIPFSLASAASTSGSTSLWQTVLISFACWEVWTLITFPVIRLAERWPFERPIRARILALHGVAALVACIVQAFSTALATELLVNPPDATLVQVFFYWLMMLAPAGVIVYSAIVALRTSELQRARLLARERHNTMLTSQLAESRLLSLRAQIQPHFLFNTLNAVIALVRDKEHQLAAQALTTLSELLRTALRTGGAHETTLREELAFTTNYLAIEELRFGDRLSVQVGVPEHLNAARVPSFLLQPFVENALRHGLRSQMSPGVVRISASVRDDQLLIVVEDNGSGLPADWEARSADGLGIANSRARLRQLYGSQSSLLIGPHPKHAGTLVQIVLPLQLHSAEAVT